MSTPPPTVELVEDQLVSAYETQIDDIVDYFWLQTHTLAVEHAALASRQNQQARQQQAALLAVHSNAESRAQAIAARQSCAEVQIERALVNTRGTLEQQLFHVARSNDLRLSESVDAIQARISQLLADAQREAMATQEALTDQASQLMRFEHEVERQVRSVHEELSARLDELSSGTTGSESSAEDFRGMLGMLEAKFRDEMAEIKRSLIDECAAATERRLRAERPTRRTRVLVDRALNEMEERVEEKLRLALQAACDGERDREDQLVHQATSAAKEADDVIDARLRTEMREAQASLEIEVRAQSAAIAVLEARVEKACEGLSRRIMALEQGQVLAPPAIATAEASGDQSSLARRMEQLEVGMKKMEQRLQDDVKQLLLHRKRSSRPVAHGPNVKRLVAHVQREVQGRAEIAARYYEML